MEKVLYFTSDSYESLTLHYSYECAKCVLCSRMHFPNDATLFTFNADICVYVAAGVRQSKLKCMRHIGRFITSSSQKFIGLSCRRRYQKGSLNRGNNNAFAGERNAFSIELKAMSPIFAIIA